MRVNLRVVVKARAGSRRDKGVSGFCAVGAKLLLLLNVPALDAVWSTAGLTLHRRPPRKPRCFLDAMEVLRVLRLIDRSEVHDEHARVWRY